MAGRVRVAGVDRRRERRDRRLDRLIGAAVEVVRRLQQEQPRDRHRERTDPGVFVPEDDEPRAESLQAVADEQHGQVVEPEIERAPAAGPPRGKRRR